MAQSRAKDPLTAAITAYFKPVVARYGFKKWIGRSFARLRDDLIQNVGFQLSAYGSKDFCVNYCTVPLFLPHDFFGWTFGGRFPRGKSNDGWWKSKTGAFADESMQEVTRTFESKIVGWFDTTATVEGFLDVVARSRPSVNVHIEFNYACCMAWLSRDQEAMVALSAAKSGYEARYREMPACTWAAQSANHCEDLIRAVMEGKGRHVLAGWRDASIAKLKLERILDP